ncbi:MAG: hypothetical protein GY928_36610 [Colwellia sp.]|nr:hypothetical protein [Colwellia sp.]
MAATKHTRIRHKDHFELCQTLLNQTRSIDETARLMGEHVRTSIQDWRKKIIGAVERGELII